MNRAGANSVNFIPGILNPDTSYTIKLEYETYLNTDGESYITFETAGKEGPFIELEYS